MNSIENLKVKQAEIINFLERLFEQTQPINNEPVTGYDISITINFDTRTLNQAEDVTFTLTGEGKIYDAEISYFTAIGASSRKNAEISIVNSDTGIPNGLLIDHKKIERASCIPNIH